MGEIKGEFTGTWIPAHIMLDKDLTSNAKIIYATIAGFNECYMSSANLGNLAGVSERGTQKILTQLKAKKYIKQVAFDGRIRTLVAVRDQQGSTEQTFAPDPTLSSPYNKYNNKTNNNISSNDSAKSDDLATLFNELRTTLKLSPQYKLSIKRKETLKRRLKEFSSEDIVKACRNLAGSPWHMGENPSRKKFADVDFLIRSYEQVEKWLLVDGQADEASYDFKKMEANKQKMREVEYA